MSDMGPHDGDRPGDEDRGTDRKGGPGDGGEPGDDRPGRGGSRGGGGEPGEGGRPGDGPRPGGTADPRTAGPGADGGRTRGGHDALIGVVAVVGLAQGGVPLVTRGLFDAEQRFTPALWLPAPWWWVACGAVVLVALALVVRLDARAPRARTAAPAAAPPPDAERTGAAAGSRGGPDVGGYDVASGAVFLLGLYNGVAPFVARLVFDSDLLLAFTLRLPSPWWWLASLAVIAVALAALIVLDLAKQRRLAQG